MIKRGVRHLWVTTYNAVLSSYQASSYKFNCKGTFYMRNASLLTNPGEFAEEISVRSLLVSFAKYSRH
jgi:hypothetical protein